MSPLDFDSPTHNPYTAPEADAEVRAESGAAEVYLASRWQRFFGALIDGALVTGLALGAAFVLAGSGLDPFPRDPQYATLALRMPSSALLFLCGLLPQALQWLLIGLRGQTVGKLAVGTRIMLADGSVAGFYRGVVLRAWPWLALRIAPDVLAALFRLESATVGTLTLLINVFVLAEVLLIFREGTRCLHDVLAGTYVTTRA